MSKTCQHDLSPHSASFAQGVSSHHSNHGRTYTMSATSSDDAAKPTPSASKYTCARRLVDVQTAWRIVYERYVDKNLIHKNAFGIHTVPQAVGRNACIIHQANNAAAGSTLTLMGDSSAGLPLDSVYARELDALRWQGRGLVEVGLLAESQRGVRRGARALFDLMRWAVYYTLHIDYTDIIIGVHPRHVRFYTRCFGLKNFAQPTDYPLVNDNPVVPLRLPLREALAAPVLPRGLAHIRNHPVDPGAFQQRFQFAPEQLRGSTIERFLDSQRDATDKSKQAPDTSASPADIGPPLPAGARPA